MNQKAFLKYLATGEYVSAMDEASLSPTEYTKSFLEHFGYVPGYQPSRTYRECADAMYKFTHNGAVAVDFRNCPALQVAEVL